MKKKQDNKDNVLYMRQNKDQDTDNLTKRQLVITKKKRMGIIVALLLCVFGVWIFGLNHKTYKGYRVVKHSDTNYENTANYIQFSGNLLKYTPDGVSYINSNGDTVWTAGVDMKMPIAVSSGNYAVVADMKGNSVYVFNTEGQVSNQTMPYTICDVDVADQGAFAVVLESDKTNYINLYDKSGAIVYEIQTTIDKSGYPLDISISDDGEKLVTSYINIVGNRVQNNIAAYNFGVVGQNANADRMVGGYTFEDQVIPRVEFVDNDTVVAFGTKSATIYSMKEKPSVKSTIQFSNEAKSVFSSKNYIGIVADVDTTDDYGPAYKVTVYNLRGNKEFDSYIDFDYDYIYAADKEIIISGGSNCRILRKNGSVKFDGVMNGRVLSVTPNGTRLEYVVVFDDATEIIRLKKDAGRTDVGTDTNNRNDDMDDFSGQMPEIATGSDSQ